MYIQRMLGSGALTLVLAVAASAHADGTRVAADIVDLHSSAGMVRCAIWPAAWAKEYPVKADHSVQVSAAIADRKAHVEWSALPAGTYAVSCYHDENNNNKLDTNLLGIPKEGLGASNGARGNFGPPKFADAQFKLGDAPLTLRIAMKY